MSSTFIETEKLNEISNGTETENDEGIADDTETSESENCDETVIEANQSEEKIDNNSSSATNDEIAVEEDKSEEWVDLLGSGAIMKKILNEGKPDSKPERTDKCIINYCCYLEDETIVESASSCEINLGDSDVIQGLDVAIGLMNINEKCRLRIEPRLAFGKKGLPPKIDGDTPVIYDVELISVEHEPDVEELTIEQRKILGNKKRERGNWWYSRGENNLAIQCYRRALDYLDEVEGGITGPLSEKGEKKEITDSDLQSLLENRVSVCNNMAAAQIKMEMYDAALNSLQIVLRCQPNNVKAHFRKAKVYLGKNDLPAALKCLQKAMELSPGDIEIQKEINRVSKLIDQQKASERELARRMFNGPKKADQKNHSKKNNDSSGKLSLWTTLGAMVALGVAGFVAYRFSDAAAKTA